MSYHLYLKKVVAVIEAKEFAGEFASLGNKLKPMGINLEWYPDSLNDNTEREEGREGEKYKDPKDFGERREGEKYKNPKEYDESREDKECKNPEKYEKCMAYEEYKKPSAGGMEEEDEAILWITDHGKLAEQLVLAQVPLLVFIHPGNRDQDFFRVQYGMEHPEEMDAEYLDRIYRRYTNKPWDILETERCLIRETVPEDVDFFYDIYNEPSITEHMDGLYPEPEQEREYIREYQRKVYSFYQFGIWTILLKETGEVIGRAGLNYRESYEDPELGFIIGRSWQGRGIATEVCREILKYGGEELDFQRVQALVEPGNVNSLAVCSKLGMQVFDRVEESGKEFIRLIIDFE